MGSSRRGAGGGAAAGGGRAAGDGADDGEADGGAQHAGVLSQLCGERTHGLHLGLRELRKGASRPASAPRHVCRKALPEA